MMSSSLTKQGQSVSKKTKNMVADIVAKVKGEPKPSDLKKAELIRNEMARKEQRKNLKATIDSVSDEEYESVKSMVRDRMASREKQKQTIDEIRIKQSEKRAAEREKQKAEAQARLQRQREWIAEQEKEQQNKMEEREQLEEAREMARDIKQAVTTRARLTPGPQSELTKAVTSMSVDKLAKAMSGPIDDVPKPLSILNSKSMLEKIINPDPSYLESLRRFVRHSEMEEETEDAGEIEDAE
jgi:phosphoglycolate phosphatase-like HAD superfamily hydrolase